MSANEPADRAFRELETLVRNLGEELATFRRRALSAETQLRDGAGPGKTRGGSDPHVAELESENEVLRSRLERAEDRVRQMMDRVRFLRQQLQTQAPAAAGASRG